MAEYRALVGLAAGEVAPASLNANRRIPITPRSAPFIGFMNAVVNLDKVLPGSGDVKARLTKQVQEFAKTGITADDVTAEFHRCQQSTKPAEDLNIPTCNRAGGRMALFFLDAYPELSYSGSQFTGKPV